MHRDLTHLTPLTSVDVEYRFGRPKVYLAPHELARLVILRSKLGDTQAERVARAAGQAIPPQHPARATSPHIADGF
jgi:hypothetical protein